MQQKCLYETCYRWIALSLIVVMVGLGYGYAFLDVHAVSLKGHDTSHAQAPSPPKPVVTPVSDTQALKKVLKKYEYNLKAVKKGQASVPRVYCSNLPKDFKTIGNQNKKQEMFLQVMLPMILRVNEQILLDRQKLLQLKCRLQSRRLLKLEERRWLRALAARYKVKSSKYPNFKELLRRVDFIPPSLALAQSIIESGWGESSAARVKNSPFGVISAERVKFSATLYESVETYTHLLNTAQAYQSMRQRRALLRQQGNPISGDYLASDLIRYSILKEAYVEKVIAIIKRHGLKGFDAAQLRHTTYSL